MNAGTDSKQYLGSLDTNSQIYGQLQAAAEKEETDYKALKDKVAKLKEKIEAIDLLKIKDSKALEAAKEKLEALEEELTAAEGALSEAIEIRQELENKLELIRGSANTRKNQIIAEEERRRRESDDDDSSSTPGTDSYIFAGTDTSIPVFDLTGLTLGDTGRGVAGVRTGRTVARGSAAENSGVLGVKTETKSDTKKVTTDTSEKTGDESKKDSGDNKLVKVENSMVPLADTPFEEGPNMNLLWLLGAAAAAGAGAYGYDKHRKKVTANDEAKKYKK